MADHVSLAFNCATVLNHFLGYTASHTLLHALKNPLLGFCSKQSSKFMKIVWNATRFVSKIHVFPIGYHYRQLKVRRLR